MLGMPSRATGMFAIGGAVARTLPARPVAMLGDGLALAAWCADRDRRRAVDDNLRHLVPGLSAATRMHLGRRTFRQRARAMIAAWRLTTDARTALLEGIVVDGRAQLSAALAEGRGAIVVAPHLGPWDVGAAWFAAAGFRPCAVVERLPHGAFEQQRLVRRSLGIDVEPHDHPRRLRQVLREGRVLLLMADRVVGSRGLTVHFAGGLRPVPMGPAALARLTGAPVVGTWIAHAPTGDRLIAGLERLACPAEASVEANTAAIGGWCGRLAARFPDQWFVFQPDWREGGTVARDEPPGRAHAGLV